MEVFLPARLPSPESLRNGTAGEAEADPGLRTAHEHHCRRHDRSALYQESGNY